MAAEPAFYRLSAELFSLILQQESQWSSGTLKILRLVHPRFAYLEDILKALFSRIVFSASPLSIQRFSETRMDGIAQYIKRIEFGSSIYSVDVSWEQFLTCAVKQSRKISLPREGKAISDWRAGIPEEEIEDAYERYRKFHGEAVDLIESGRAVSVLASQLKSFENARSIYIGPLYPDYHPFRDGDTIEGMVLSEQLDDDSKPHAFQLEDELLKLTVKFLAESGTKPVDLTIACWITGIEDWSEMPGWDSLDLSETKELTLMPYSQAAYTLEEADELERRRSRVAGGCSGLIAKAASSIERLHLETLRLPWGVHFAGLETPKLRILGVFWVSFDAEPFSQWLLRCHQLEEITMERVGIIGPRRSWRTLFEAIRSMSNAVVFILNEVELTKRCGDNWVYTPPHALHGGDRIAETMAGEVDVDFVPALSAFLTGDAEWSSSLDDGLWALEDEM